ncbi:MAG: SDR family oxidoreductase [Candidatus Omnitrophota bacterium]|nr:SDR family oxidoreductase [Candidatus Omnitrophota bacterium]
MDNKKTVFLTGATGLVGSYLLKILLENDCKVYALARNKDNKSAKERVVETLKFWDAKVLDKISNLVVLGGDITKENLELDKETKDLLENEIDEIFHLAAITRFDAPLEELRRVNVEGTKKVLELSLEWHKKGRLKKVNYFSTAYVCGDYKSVFKEKDLDVGQKFNIPYEQSKFEAEKVVDEYRKKDLWVDIFRPPAVVGESTTGKTFRFNHIYELLRLWSLDILDFFPTDERFSLNLTCVDHTIQTVYFIFHNITIKNINYHLFGEKQFFTREIFELARKYIGFTKTQPVSFEEFNEKNISPVQRNIMKRINLINVVPQIKLDSTYTRNILKKYAFNFPEFTAEHFSKIIQYGSSYGFIKKHILYKVALKEKK